MGVRGFDLLRIAAAKKIPVVMLTAHSLTPESLKKSIELGARAFLPKDKLGKLAPFIKDVITLRYHQAWKSILSRLGGAFGKSLGPEWRTSEEEFWKKFEKDLEVHESLIVEH
jgi:DNA-binding NarL/FixJ family response regulator